MFPDNRTVRIRQKGEKEDSGTLRAALDDV